MSPDAPEIALLRCGRWFGPLPARLQERIAQRHAAVVPQRAGSGRPRVGFRLIDILC